MRAVFGGHIGPMIVYKGRNGEPHIPIILSCQCVETNVLLDPLIFLFCESVSLWVESSANVSSYA